MMETWFLKFSRLLMKLVFLCQQLPSHTLDILSYLLLFSDFWALNISGGTTVYNIGTIFAANPTWVPFPLWLNSRFSTRHHQLCLIYVYLVSISFLYTKFPNSSDSAVCVHHVSWCQLYHLNQVIKLISKYKTWNIQ